MLVHKDKLMAVRVTEIDDKGLLVIHNLTKVPTALPSDIPVRDAADCGLKTALALSGRVNDVLEEIQNQSKYRRNDAQTWSCQICGRGKYRDNIGANYSIRGYRQGGPADQQSALFQVMVCDQCKHAELFLVGFGTN